MKSSHKKDLDYKELEHKNDLLEAQITALKDKDSGVKGNPKTEMKQESAPVKMKLNKKAYDLTGDDVEEMKYPPTVSAEPNLDVCN